MEYRVLRIRFRPVRDLQGLVDLILHSWNFVCIPLSTRDHFLNLIYFYYLVVTDCRNRQDGTRRSPWNEIECGDHYARAMAAFLYFEIASGMVKMIYFVFFYLTRVSVTDFFSRHVEVLFGRGCSSFDCRLTVYRFLL